MSFTAYSEQEGHFLTLPNGQRDHFYIDSFVDPWLPKEKKAVLLIQHGYARSGKFWYHWVPTLARDYIVIRRDLRGHGKSSFPTRSNVWEETKGQYVGYVYNVNSIVGEIVQFLDALQIERVHFLGESTSGELGLALAALYPDRLHSLVLCSSPTHLPPTVCQFLAMGYNSWPESVVQLGSREWAEKLASESGTAPTESPEYLEWWLQGVGQNTAEGMAGYADFLSHLDCREYLTKVKCPTLILAPTNSKPVPLSVSESMKKGIKNSKLCIVEAPGHEIYVEKPEECISHTIAFLKGLRTDHSMDSIVQQASSGDENSCSDSLNLVN